MYFIPRALLFFSFIYATQYSADAYFVPVCSKNGGVCSKNVESYTPGLNLDNVVCIQQISQRISKVGLLFRPLRKACAYVLLSTLDLVKDVLNLEVLMESSPPPPPTILEHILGLVCWNTVEERQFLINPGLTVYLLIISCTIWMFVCSFYAKATCKNDFEWPIKKGFIFDSSMRQSIPYPQLCNECMSKVRK